MSRTMDERIEKASEICHMFSRVARDWSWGFSLRDKPILSALKSCTPSKRQELSTEFFRIAEHNPNCKRMSMLLRKLMVGYNLTCFILQRHEQQSPHELQSIVPILEVIYHSHALKEHLYLKDCSPNSHRERIAYKKIMRR